MSLDLLASIGCGWVALVLFMLHVISSPRRRSWMTIPEYVRHGFLVTGTMFMWRSVNFATLRDGQLGHANAEGLMALFAMVYTVSALAFWLVRIRLKNQGWARLEWLRDLMRKDPSLAPVPLNLNQVAQTHQMLGATVNANPGAGFMLNADPPEDGPAS